MTAKKVTSRRQHFLDDVSKESVDQTPVEIPAGSEIPKKGIAQQIQEQIAIQIAKKRSGVSS